MVEKAEIVFSKRLSLIMLRWKFISYNVMTICSTLLDDDINVFKHRVSSCMRFRRRCSGKLLKKFGS